MTCGPSERGGERRERVFDGNRHGGQDLRQHVGGAAAAQAGLGVGDEAVREHRGRQPLDVVWQHVAAALHARQRLRRVIERQRRPRAGAELDRSVQPRRAHQPHDVVLDRLGHVDLARQPLHGAQLGLRDDRRQVIQRTGRPKAPHDALFVRLARIADRQPQQEAVELRLRQREGALELDGILRREHQERSRQRPRLTFQAHLALLHALQHGRLRARRGAVDLVGQDDLREDRAGPKLEFLVALVEERHPGDVAGQQVGRELDAAERAVERPRHGPGQHGLADARHVLDQHVPLAQQRHQQQVDDVALADDHPPNIVPRPLRHRADRPHVQHQGGGGLGTGSAKR